MEVSTVDQLVQKFESRMAVLSNAVMLSHGLTQDSYLHVSDSLNGVLDSTALKLRGLARNVNTAKSQLQSLEELKSQSQQMLQHLQFALSNIPPHLPQRKPVQNGPSEVCSSTGSDQEVPQPDGKTASSCCEYLDFLTVEEFEAVPKYMKGRLTYSKVNSVIEQLDRVYIKKYKIVRQKRTDLNDVNRKRWEGYRQQENSDSKGIPFIVDKDISDFSTLRVDAAMRNILTILRHAGFVHEIRGGGHVRYAAAPRY